jgi:microcystin-dependent protein
MAEPFLAEIRIFSFNFPPKGWAMCDGQLMPINQNQALFSLLGTTYGGDGITTFALPNLQGRLPVHTGNGIFLGESGGEASHTLIPAEMPQHTHAVSASANPANQGVPTGNLWAAGNAAYNPNFNTIMNPACVTSMGGGQAHPNLSPYLTVTLCIALQGIFPSQN